MAGLAPNYARRALADPETARLPTRPASARACQACVRGEITLRLGRTKRTVTLVCHHCAGRAWVPA